ncbi:PD40 domain-containing protein [Persicobacter sp. CCB-QB2]|uniref:TolB family protein n=1 Tax=Persicobacter sp. CCB-QB2 TaxID=1561025 RepID=UPI0006A9B260|nr:PD40 domain-containing protein [Persicobacter sp. CCB-QB2]
MYGKFVFPTLLSILLITSSLFAQTKSVDSFLNGKQKVYGATVSAGGNVMVYVSNYKKKKTIELFEVTKNENDKWGEPIRLTNLSNKFEIITDPFISYDANFLLFSAIEKGGASYDIYFSERRGSVWQTPRPVGGEVNTWKVEGSPSLSLDGKQLYFLRDEFGDPEKGRTQLYVADWAGDASYNNVRLLKGSFNEQNVKRPILYRGGNVILMSLQKDNKIGGYDVNYTYQLEDGTWSDPLPLAFMNTPKDDFLAGLPVTGEAVYTTVDQELFQIEIPESIPATPLVLMKGYLRDRKVGMHVDAVVRLIEVGSNKEVLVGRNNPTDGFYSIIAPVGKKYKLNFFSKNHVEFDTLLDFSGIQTFVQYDQNIEMTSEVLVQYALQDLSSLRPTSGEIRIFTGNQLIHSSYFEAGQQPQQIPLPLGYKYQFEIISNTCQPYRGIINFQDSKRYPAIFEKKIRMRRKLQEIYFEILTPEGEKPKDTTIQVKNLETEKGRTYSAVSLAYLEYGSRYQVEVMRQDEVLETMNLVVDPEGKIYRVSQDWQWGQPLKQQVTAPEGPKIEMKLEQI